MAGYLLSVLESSVVFKVNRDPGCSPCMTSDWGEKIRRFSPLPNRSPGVVPIKRSSGSSLINALEEGLSVLKAYGHSVLVQDLEQEVVEHLLR
jgi:hypothetical protein